MGGGRKLARRFFVSKKAPPKEKPFPQVTEAGMNQNALPHPLPYPPPSSIRGGGAVSRFLACPLFKGAG